MDGGISWTPAAPHYWRKRAAAKFWLEAIAAAILRAGHFRLISIWIGISLAILSPASRGQSCSTRCCVVPYSGGRGIFRQQLSSAPVGQPEETQQVYQNARLH